MPNVKIKLSVDLPTCTKQQYEQWFRHVFYNAYIDDNNPLSMYSLFDMIDTEDTEVISVSGFSECKHKYIDIRNEVILNGSMCSKCNKLFNKNVEDLSMEVPYVT